MSESHTADLPTRYRYRQEGAEFERERIRQQIMSRVTDLKSCGSKDNCEEVAQLLLDWMPEWLGEEK